MRFIPNILTLARIVAIPLVIAIWLLRLPFGDMLCALIVAVAGVTDFVDGWLARKLDAQSNLGRMLDPIADKALVAICLLLLVADGRVDGVHIIAAAVILAREILISGLREFLMEQHIALPVSRLAKYKTTLQIMAMVGLLANLREAGLVLLWVAMGVTVLTAIGYLRGSFANLRG